MTSTNFLFVIFFVLYGTEQIHGTPPKQFGPRCPHHLPSPRPNRKGLGLQHQSYPLSRIGEDSGSNEIGRGPRPDDIFQHIPPFTRPLPSRIQQLQEEDSQCDPHRRPPSPYPRRRCFSMPGPSDRIPEDPEDNEIPGARGPHHHHHHPHHSHHHHHHHHHSHGHRHHPGCDCGCSQGPDLETNDIE